MKEKNLLRGKAVSVGNVDSCPQWFILTVGRSPYLNEEKTGPHAQLYSSIALEKDREAR